MIHKIGDFIQRVTSSVKRFGISPHSDVIVRVGDDGPELPIEHLKVQGGLMGPRLVIQARKPQ